MPVNSNHLDCSTTQFLKPREMKRCAKSSAFLHLFPGYHWTSWRGVVETAVIELPVENYGSTYLFLKGLGTAKEQMLPQNGLVAVIHHSCTTTHPTFFESDNSTLLGKNNLVLINSYAEPWVWLAGRRGNKSVHVHWSLSEQKGSPWWCHGSLSVL